MRNVRAAFFAFCLILAAGAVQAQSATVNPTTVLFTPSANHSDLGLDGMPMVARYELQIYVETGMTLVSSTDLGKPVPVNDTISVTNPVWFAGLTPNTRYVAKVAAIGPTGQGVSDPSGPFGNSGPPARPTGVLLRK